MSIEGYVSVRSCTCGSDDYEVWGNNVCMVICTACKRQVSGTGRNATVLAWNKGDELGKQLHCPRCNHPVKACECDEGAEFEFVSDQSKGE